MKKSTLTKDLKTQWPLHVMLLPAVILLLIFSYYPMIGIIIAFQDYVPSKGWDIFFKSEWVGLENFTYIMKMPGFWRSMGNTVTIAIQKIVSNIFAPLLMALLLNEVGHRGFKKAVQTLIYIPYFFSWVILGGILMMAAGDEMILVGLLVAGVGCLGSWLSSLFLYGFGELIAKITQIEKNTRK